MTVLVTGGTGVLGRELVRLLADQAEQYPVDAPAEQIGMDYVVYTGAAGGPMLCGRMTMTADFGDVPPHWMIYFNVDNADNAAERVTASGGLVAVAPFDTPFRPNDGCCRP